MSHLSAVRYHDPAGAERVRDELLALEAARLLEINDLIV